MIHAYQAATLTSIFRDMSDLFFEYFPCSALLKLSICHVTSRLALARQCQLLRFTSSRSRDKRGD